VKEIGIICLVLAAFLGGGGLWAHHSPSAEFDMSKSFSVSGTLTKVDWINPHIMMLLDVNGEEWKFESNPPAWFRRVGIARADFADAIGQKISVDGVRARDGSKFGYMLRAKFASGRALELVREEGK
jgi:Family of unknown function (DUF6152)